MSLRHPVHTRSLVLFLSLALSHTHTHARTRAHTLTPLSHTHTGCGIGRNGELALQEAILERHARIVILGMDLGHDNEVDGHMQSNDLYDHFF